jgi:hypothetical protein
MSTRYRTLANPAAGLHPKARCSWCGARAVDVALKRMVHTATQAPALACVDVAACLRRRKDSAA